MYHTMYSVFSPSWAQEVYKEQDDSHNYSNYSSNQVGRAQEEVTSSKPGDLRQEKKLPAIEGSDRIVYTWSGSNNMWTAKQVYTWISCWSHFSSTDHIYFVHQFTPLNTTHYVNSIASFPGSVHVSTACNLLFTCGESLGTRPLLH